MTYRRDLSGQLDRLGELELTGLEGALEVDVANLLAQVGLCGDEADEAVLDDEQDVGALLDGLLDDALGLDDELLATICVSVSVVLSLPLLSRPCPASGPLTPGEGWGRGRRS